MSRKSGGGEIEDLVTHNLGVHTAINRIDDERKRGGGVIPINRK